MTREFRLHAQYMYCVENNVHVRDAHALNGESVRYVYL